MASLRTSFEKEIRFKLGQKSTAHQGEEQVLMKAFRYFDLDNSGKVDRNEFKKVIEKIGIQIFNAQDFDEIFNYYDADGDQELDYREFSSILFGNSSSSTRQNSATKQDSRPAYSRNGNDGVEQVIEKFRNRLKSRGGTGILGLGRQFRIFDDDNSKSLCMNEFRKAIRDFKVDITDTETEQLFQYFDRDGNGNMNYDEFLLGVRGPMNQFRRRLVNQAFDKLDKDGSGEITVDDLIGIYNGKMHPDVKAGKKTEDDVLKEFLSTFESYSDIRGIKDGIITREEFEDYYTFISASIDNDQYFELMINNAWRMNEGANKNWNTKGWSNKDQGSNGKSLQQGYEQKRPQTAQQSSQSGKQQNRQDNVQSREDNYSSRQEPRQERREQVKKSGRRQNDAEVILQRIRAKLATRGCKGFLGIQRQFKIMDDDNDKSISYAEFQKAMRDYKIELTENELNQIFEYVDKDGNGTLSIDEIVRAIRGEMNDFRRRLVDQVFDKMDRDGDGTLRVNDIKGLYSGKLHPDVKAGKKTEDEVLGEFLETFETHHNLKTGSRDQNVTREEFEEYYNNVSANIDNDQYFELMISNSYKIDTKNNQAYRPNTSQGAGWKGDYSNDFRSKTTSNAPFGTSSSVTDWSTSANSRPQTAQQREQPREQQRDHGERQEKVKRSGKPQGNQQAQEQEHNFNPNIERLLKMFRDKINARGARGIFGIGRLFKIIDDDNSKALNSQEFKKCIKDFRLDYSDIEAEALFRAFDSDRSGEISYDEFLRTIRGPLSEGRKKWVNLAFKKLDKTGDGVINLDDLRGVYNAKNHPDVKAGKKTEDDILGEFLDTFETHHATLTGDFKMRDKNVTQEEFYEYYANVSCSIDNDQYFELMMKNSWKL